MTEKKDPQIADGNGYTRSGTVPSSWTDSAPITHTIRSSDMVKTGPVGYEQQARDMLERIGVDDAQSFTAGDVVELANLIGRRGERTQPSMAFPQMSLRDYFAGQAMAAFIVSAPTRENAVTDESKCSAWAYAQADAMLKAREE